MSRFTRLSVVVVSVAALISLLLNVSKTPGTKNVCSNIDDYFSVETNSKCWYDPDVDVNSNVTQIIINNGYDSETHEITSPDGQIITVFRVVNKRTKTANKGPVYMQHGLTGSSIGWVGLGKDSLAFMLSDAGYDVWMGNARGTIYSMKHTKYTNKDPEFWNHSYHEMATIDLPAIFKYIRAKDNRKILYIGLSMGTTQALVYSSTFTKEAKESINLFVLFSPIITNQHSEGFMYWFMGPAMKLIQEVLPNGFYDIWLDFTTGKYNRIQFSFLPMYLQIKVAGTILKLYQALDLYTIRPETIPKVIAHNPHGASVKTHVHLFAFAKEFRQYDYGKENLKIYGTEFPPEYKLSDIKVPMYMYYSDEDEISSTEAIVNLYKTLSPEARFGIHKIVPEKNTVFTHMDFIYGAHVRKQVYEHLLNVVKEVKD